jgi:hypothetical protein
VDPSSSHSGTLTSPSALTAPAVFSRVTGSPRASRGHLPRVTYSFRINTCKSVSKQTTLTPFRMNTYEKQGEGGVHLSSRELCPHLKIPNCPHRCTLCPLFSLFEQRVFENSFADNKIRILLKTAGCVGTGGSIRPSLFIRLVLFCLPEAARAAIATKPLRFCHIQWRTGQG